MEISVIHLPSEDTKENLGQYLLAHIKTKGFVIDSLIYGIFGSFGFIFPILFAVIVFRRAFILFKNGVNEDGSGYLSATNVIAANKSGFAKVFITYAFPLYILMGIGRMIEGSIFSFFTSLIGSESIKLGDFTLRKFVGGSLMSYLEFFTSEFTGIKILLFIIMLAGVAFVALYMHLPFRKLIKSQTA